MSRYIAYRTLQRMKKWDADKVGVVDTQKRRFCVSFVQTVPSFSVLRSKLACMIHIRSESPKHLQRGSNGPGCCVLHVCSPSATPRRSIWNPSGFTLSLNSTMV